MGGDAHSQTAVSGYSPDVIGGAPEGYAGDISVGDGWQILETNPNAVLVDVRTQAEWSYVGLPDLSPLGRQPILIEWQCFPTGEVNPAFAEQLAEALGKTPKETPVLFLCRSGARSKSAAIALTRKGYSTCYNLAKGFEGDLDSLRRRGSQNGWKAAGLPWVQS